MPSGAKKRKAAKKKKAHLQHPHSREHDDTRQHEEKDSDGGEAEAEAEALSPASQAQSDPFPTDGAEELEDVPPPIGSATLSPASLEVKPAEVVALLKPGYEENEEVEIVKSVKSEDSSEGKTLDIGRVQVEAVEISTNGNKEKADNIGLDDGSRIDDKNVEQDDVEVVQITTRSHDFMEETTSVPHEPAQIVESSIVIDSIEKESTVFEKVIEVSETLKEETLADSELASKDQNQKVVRQIDEPSEFSETMLELPPVLQASLEKMNEAATVVIDKIDSKAANDEKVGKFCTSQEVSLARADDSIETAKDPLRHDPSENKPPIAPALNVQKTSWFSCCGIFDVVTSSR